MREIINLIFVVIVILLCVWGCNSCIRAIDDTYPPARTDWDEVERHKKSLKYTIPPTLTEQEKLEKAKADSAWKAEVQHRREEYIYMMQAAGKAEEEWRREHNGEHEIMSTYGEGYDDAFLDRQNHNSSKTEEYGVDYDAGYSDGY